MYKALSVRQPWASLIGLREKPLEVRSWSTDYRGDLLINSSGKDMFDGGEFVGPGGVSICLVNLTGVRPLGKNDFAEACLSKKAVAELLNTKKHYAWSFENVREVVPVRIKGRLSLYNVPLLPDLLPSEYECHIDYYLEHGAVSFPS